MTYRLLSLLLWPALFIYTLKIALRDKSLRYFQQRLGFTYVPQKNKILWIHCASVGEVNTYMPLHRRLLEKYPQYNFLISTNTTTGAATVKRHHSERTQHCYLPIESSFAIKRFLRAWQPQHGLIMETEIWPLLYRLCEEQQIPLSIINARLSHRSLNTRPWIQRLYRQSLSRVTKILCKSSSELDNFRTLGASEAQLEVVGNLKFAQLEHATPPEVIDLNQRPYCVAASTHHNEEQQLAEIWKNIHTDRLLVIVPRHPNRSESIQKQLDKLNIAYATRSKNQPIDQHTRIYLADTLGELTAFMAGADFVFTGGSLIPHGGQNILEAARLGKITLCGSHMFNFKDELKLLLEHQACIQVETTEQLAKTFEQLLNNPQAYAYLAENARAALQQQSGVLDHYILYLGDSL